MTTPSKRPAAAAAASAIADKENEKTDIDQHQPKEDAERDLKLLKASRRFKDVVPADAHIPIDDPKAPINDAALHRAALYLILPLWKQAVTLPEAKRWNPRWKLKIHYPITLSLLAAPANNFKRLLEEEESVVMTTVCTMERTAASSASHIAHFVTVIYDTRKGYRRITVMDPLGWQASDDASAVETDLERLVLLLTTQYEGKLDVVFIDECLQSDGYQCGLWAIATLEAYFAYALLNIPSVRFTMLTDYLYNLKDTNTVKTRCANERWIAQFRAFLAKLSHPSRSNPAIEEQFGNVADHSAFLKT